MKISSTSGVSDMATNFPALQRLYGSARDWSVLAFYRFAGMHRGLRAQTKAALHYVPVALIFACIWLGMRQHAAALAQERHDLQETLRALDKQQSLVDQNRMQLDSTASHVGHFTEEFTRSRWTGAFKAIADCEDVAFRNLDDQAPDVFLRSSLSSGSDEISVLTMRVAVQRGHPNLCDFILRCVSTGRRPRLAADAFSQALSRAVTSQFSVPQPAHFLSLEDTAANLPPGLQQSVFDLAMTVDMDGTRKEIRARP